MRIPLNQPRLRVIALGCCVLSGWLITYGGRLALAHTASLILVVCIELLALLSLAIGIAFWLLGNDRQAGITFDSKGLMLNLGHSASFISWHNIERIGVTRRRNSLFTLGSHQQLGIVLRDVHPYLQSYEARLPSGHGALAFCMRLIDGLLRPWVRVPAAPTVEQIAFCHAQTGYDVLVPESLLGGKADAFMELVELYRLHPTQRRSLESLAWAH